MPPTAGHDDDISHEARMMAARARARAASLPDAAAIAAMALTAGGRMSEAEIRELATTAIAQAAQVSYLLGRLASTVPEDRAGGGCGAR